MSAVIDDKRRTSRVRRLRWPFSRQLSLSLLSVAVLLLLWWGRWCCCCCVVWSQESRCVVACW